MTTQLDVLNAQLAMLQNRLEGVTLQGTAQSAQINLQITQVQRQIAALPADPA